MDVTIGISLVLLMAVFVVISVYYFRKQARALEYMAEIEETRFMRQRQLWRREDAARFDLTPMKWLEGQVEGALGITLNLLEPNRRVAAPPALEVLADEGRRVVFSPVEPRGMRKAFGGRGRKDGSGTARLETLVQETPLLGRNPRRVISGERSLVDDEWFDVMAGRVGKELDVNWGEPQRLWVYLVPQEK